MLIGTRIVYSSLSETRIACLLVIPSDPVETMGGYSDVAWPRVQWPNCIMADGEPSEGYALCIMHFY